MNELDDSDPRAATVQLELLRRATPARRGTAMSSLSRTVIEASRRALRERTPGASEREVELRWIALQYGEELARRVAEYLAARGR